MVLIGAGPAPTGSAPSLCHDCEKKQRPDAELRPHYLPAIQPPLDPEEVAGHECDGPLLSVVVCEHRWVTPEELPAYSDLILPTVRAVMKLGVTLVAITSLGGD